MKAYEHIVHEFFYFKKEKPLGKDSLIVFYLTEVFD